MEIEIRTWENCLERAASVLIEDEELALAHNIKSPQALRFEAMFSVAKTTEEFHYVAHNAPMGSEVQNLAFRKFVSLTSDLGVLWEIRLRMTLLHHQRMHALSRYKVVFDGLVNQATAATIMELLSRPELEHDDLNRNKANALKQLVKIAGVDCLDFVMAHTQEGDAVRNKVIVMATKSRLAALAA